jgi:hypothetical protein
MVLSSAVSLVDHGEACAGMRLQVRLHLTEHQDVDKACQFRCANLDREVLKRVRRLSSEFVAMDYPHDPVGLELQITCLEKSVNCFDSGGRLAASGGDHEKVAAIRFGVEIGNYVFDGLALKRVVPIADVHPASFQNARLPT